MPAKKKNPFPFKGKMAAPFRANEVHKPKSSKKCDCPKGKCTCNKK
jgi:hypothetical protein